MTKKEIFDKFNKYKLDRYVDEDVINFVKELGIEIDEELKPCPFCGEEVLYNWKAVKEVIVECKNCKIQSPIFFSKEDVLKYWNNRKDK